VKEQATLVLKSPLAQGKCDPALLEAKGFSSPMLVDFDFDAENFLATFPSARDTLDAFLEKHRSAELTLILAGVSSGKRLCPRLLDFLGSRRFQAILRLDLETLNLHPHRPLEHLASRTLAVFPGPVIPLTMGSHRRIYQLCANMLKHGDPIDLLLTGAKHHAEASIPLLEQVCPRIHRYGITKPQLPFAAKIRRRLEDWLFGLRGKSAPPSLFSERLESDAPFSGAKSLRRLAESGRYANIIVSYAWLDRIRRLVPPGVHSRIWWFCDTHDVQYVRNAGSDAVRDRVLATESSEKRRELEVLRSYDKVIAISPSDSQTLTMELGAERVILASNGFDYALMPPKPIDPSAPVFGFIGRNMEANALSLADIFGNWWPALRRRWPQATFRVGGDIVENEVFRKNAFLKPEILADGFVPDLQAWFSGVDILLNPVIVQGGMNFKAIEALVGGRLLLTNPKGVISFGDSSLAIVAENGDAAVPLLEAELTDPGTWVRRRREQQKKAQAHFGDDVALLDLSRALHAPAPPAPSLSSARPSRVLIQAGDHHENRLRILPLAQGIRARGHHPVVLVYSREHVAPYLAAGVDAVALYDFNENADQRKARLRAATRITRLSEPYKGFDLDDVADMAQLQFPSKFNQDKLAAAVDEITLHIDRCLRVIDHVQPDCLLVWNGHTGYVANALRHYARSRSLPAFFLERSLLPDGVFIDPNGSNGNSQLAHLDIAGLRTLRKRPAARGHESVLKQFSQDELTSLREVGPWRQARRIICVPLQVQLDTNILLYSPKVKKMADLVAQVHERFGGPDTAIIVRPHPEEVNSDLGLPEIENVYLTSQGDLEAWIQLADLVVTINSTVGLTALLHGRPTLSLGYGIYTGKGLSEGSEPDKEDRALFWDILLTRYTSLPEDPLPDCLAEILTAMGRAPFIPCNPYGLDPDVACEQAAKAKEKIRATILKEGILRIAADLVYTDSLNLDYRRHSLAVSLEMLQTLFRQRLSLPKDFKIEMVERRAAHAMVSRSSAPSPRPSFDRYGWVLPLINKIITPN
jgi:hypothetical protein